MIVSWHSFEQTGEECTEHKVCASRTMSNAPWDIFMSTASHKQRSFASVAELRYSGVARYDVGDVGQKRARKMPFLRLSKIFFLAHTEIW